MRGHARVRLVGQADTALASMLTDVLRDDGVLLQVGAHAAEVEAPDVVLAIAGRHDLSDVLAEAVAEAAGAPVVAVLPFGDDRLGERAVKLGARAWYGLDAPVAQLRASIVALARTRR